MKRKQNPIRPLRQAAGLTQQAAADRAGLTQSHWSAIEKRPTLDDTSAGVLKRMAKALGVGVEKLLN